MARIARSPVLVGIHRAVSIVTRSPSPVSRPIEALLSCRAIAANIDIVKRAAPTSRVWAVLKADAYGHGLMRVADTDSPALTNADGIAILDLEAAELLRERGWTKPILLLEGCFDAGDLERAMRSDVTVTVHHDEQIAMIEAARPVQHSLRHRRQPQRRKLPPR